MIKMIHKTSQIDEAFIDEIILMDFGINIIGFASANIGLGHSTREFVRVLLDRGVDVRILDLDPGHGLSNIVNTFQHLFVDNASDLPHPVNLLVLSASALADLALFPPRGLTTEGRLNVAFVWWELPQMPSHWYEAGRYFDVLIAGSDFVQNTLAMHIPGVPVLLAPHPIEMPDRVLPNRARFSLPEAAFLVCMGFDPHSDTVRKNPFGAIKAFKIAYSGRADCHLVIKVNNPNVTGKSLHLLEQVYQIAREDTRIHLIEDSLPYGDLLSLYASCDAFISLHRSEGLGLMPLEAMRLGKPVISTGWSGNMSYMNQRNSCQVNFDFQPINDDSPLYGPKALGINNYWAEPDIGHAAAWLRKLADDTDFRLKLGRYAANDAARYQENAKQAEFVDELRSIWENRDLASEKNRPAILQNVREMREQDELRQLGAFNRIGRKIALGIKRNLDRHLLWRFRKP
jgi:glycosyltransferase involved in cell wall biosynthesis